MARRKKPVPKSQAELLQKEIDPVLGTGKPPVPNSKKRENQRSVKGDDVKRFTVGFKVRGLSNLSNISFGQT